MTTVRAAYSGSDVILINRLVNVAISGLTITGGWDGIGVYYSSPTITGNALTANSASGVASFYASPTITGNTMTQNGMIGVYNQGTTKDITITNNTISANKQHGVVFIGSAAGTLMGNTVTGNLGRGVSVEQSSWPQVFHNTVMSNGTDIFVDGSSTSSSRISLNVCFSSQGLSAGKYNLNPLYSPATDPCFVLN